MIRWFDHLSIHRKLVAIALFVTTTALTLAGGGLMILDLLSYRRGAVTTGAGLVMLVLAAGVAFLLAHRLHRTVSQPIAQLADAVRALEAGGPAPALPRIDTGLDEVGDLVKAFDDMLRLVGEATESLRRKDVECAGLLAREREASRLKDEFLATVSHELRTPLNAILGWTQILTSAQVDDATRQRALETIARNAQAQARVIEDLIDVSRIVTGTLSLSFSPVDLRDAVEGAVEVIRPAARTRHITLTVDLPPAPSFVRGDRDRLQQIIGNLLSNAVKFTAAGGAVTVRIVRSDSLHEVQVSDTGAGIPAAFLPFVFDRLRQADGSTTRAHGGLGLGLALVKELTELHGGSVDVTSEGSGRGSCFVVRLPAFHGRDETTALESSGAVVPTKALEGVRVLVVDDNLDALDVLSTTLATAGADVRTAASGREALATWSRQPADILLCDIAMPDIDGLEVLRRIREADGRAGRFTPAVALSAHTSLDRAARSVEAGFARHLTKPYAAADLVRTLSDVLAQQP